MNRIFPYLYSIFILSQYLIGQIYLPGLPFNILQITTILMLILCIMMEQRIPHDRCILIYFMFLLFYLLSAIITGYTETLLSSVLPQLLISFTAFWTTKILVQRYDTLLPLIIPVIIKGVLDSVVTISQAVGTPIVSPIIVMLMQNPEVLDVATHGMLGFSVSGLFINPVFNGHNLLFCFVCSLFLFQGRYKLVGLVISTIIFVGLFFCQQRSAFYLSVLVLVLMGWKLMQNNLKTKIFVLLISSLVIFYLLPYVESYAIDSGSRILDTDMTSRKAIWTTAAAFLSDHFFLGGFDMFVQHTGKYPHNLFFSAFLAGGLIGGSIMLFLICNLLIVALKSLKYYNKHNICILVSACLIISLIGDSLTHNTGLVEADFSTFLAMSLCYYYNERNPQKIFKTI